MPLGIQFIGNILEESSLLNISNKFELGEKWKAVGKVLLD
jgi:Asp-tRNA(Asn)/Glu-tRNA(Gln) amidotransferase A subunit family amidase